MTSFFDNVKDRVRNEQGESRGQQSGEQGSGGNNMDRLIENAEQNDVDQDEQEADETEIEDLTGQENKEYGDPSEIELNETSEPQAGRQNDDTDSSGQDGDDMVEIHEDGTVGEPGDEEESQETAGDQTELLREIRDQNTTIIELLRSIERKL
ncbi:MAG: hypothetical protein SVU32_03120 [Candidatus Nanohaloarchaea archaeon]|nr:hypothetical protein [Candidatus Nanohaloarchaea archaeon]